MSGTPLLELPPEPLPVELDGPSDPPPETRDLHLRSALAVNGYHIQASDGEMGHICDFMIDDQSWAIAQLVVKTGHRFSGKEVEIPTSLVDRINYEESAVYVNLTSKAVQESRAHGPAPMGAAH